MKKIRALTVLAQVFVLLHLACSTEFQVGEDGEDVDTEARDQVTGDPDSDDAGGPDTTDAADAADAPSDTTEEEEVVIPPNCGDGNVDDDEDCDDGNEVNGDGCDNDCSWSCEENEDCDDGHGCTDDICDTDAHTCDNPVSGGDTVCRDPADNCDKPEFCDGESGDCPEDETQEDGFVCGEDPRSICLDGECGESTCGDGFVDEGGGEFCEPPGEGRCNDECGFDCEGSEDCPNDGEDCNGEEFCDMDESVCDRRNALEDGTECGDDAIRQICITATCQASSCGDGFIDGGADPAEECEDGNSDSGDGCEPGDCRYSCHAESEDDDCYDELICSNDKCNMETHRCENPPEGADFLCRESTGECDAADYCDGDNLDCPDDGFQPPGTNCGDPYSDDCDGADTCDGGGLCRDNFADDGAYCGDPTDEDCNDRDTCDGDGNCRDNFWGPGDSCGDPADEDCNDPDRCDSEGNCLDNFWGPGDSCGDPADEDCNDPDRCDDVGNCLDNFWSSGSRCGDDTDEDCNDPDTCDSDGNCLDNFWSSGTGCGSTSATECTGRDFCDGAGACDPNHMDAGAFCGSNVITDCTARDTCDGDGACQDNHAPDCTVCQGLTGACETGECLYFAYGLPSGYTWTCVGSGPVADKPSGCGSADYPCNIGDFKFNWPPDTGQTNCYDIAGNVISCSQCDAVTPSVCGQDAQYGKDATDPGWASGRFVDSGSVINDTVTGLVWADTSTAGNPLDWSEGLDHCNTLNSSSFGGYNTWHVPYYHGLFSIANLGRTAPATDFPGHTSEYCWSLTTSPLMGSLYAQFTSYSSGYTYVNAKDQDSGIFTARCVTQDNQPDWPSARYYLHAADGVVFDTRTGLLWNQTVYDPTSWANALGTCETLDHAGMTGWRLPNALELRSILDMTRAAPSVDTGVFPGTPTGNDSYFWTSTSAGSKAWQVRSNDGLMSIYYGDKDGDSPGKPGYGRCVALGPGTCPGWYDGTSGLCWQDPPMSGGTTWDGAMSYCNSLGDGGWHLPTISELRSLVRECPAMAWDLPGWTCTDPCCGVSDTCDSYGDCFTSNCNPSCPDLSPPDCYWPWALRGLCTDRYWSSTENADLRDNAWNLYFDEGRLFHSAKTYGDSVRCVRSWP